MAMLTARQVNKSSSAYAQEGRGGGRIQRQLSFGSGGLYEDPEKLNASAGGRQWRYGNRRTHTLIGHHLLAGTAKYEYGISRERHLIAPHVVQRGFDKFKGLMHLSGIKSGQDSCILSWCFYPELFCMIVVEQ